MNVKKAVPNLFTLGNLFCGTIAAIAAVNANYHIVGLFVIVGIVLDFFDGFLARILHVSGELGKQLDSLADMVTSGVVPGIVLYNLLKNNTLQNNENVFFTVYLPYIGLLVTLAACYRLAKFNIDTRQSDSFIGMPTPAMSLFVIALPLIVNYSDTTFFTKLIESNYFLIGIVLVLSYLMNAEIPLFSLKFKQFGFKENALRYLFLVISLGLIVGLQFVAIPLIILLYVVLSMINNVLKKTV